MPLKAQTPQGELALANTMQQFNARNCGRGMIKVLEAEHGAQAQLHAPVSGEFASSGDRGLKQTPTVLLPSMAIKRCASRG